MLSSITLRNWSGIVAPLACLLALCSARGAAAQQSLESLEEQAMRAAADQVAPAVVRIETFGGLERVGRLLVGTGPTTGLVVSEDGYVISSAFNFVQEPTSILVTLPDGKRAAAEIVARDQSRMLVLLKVNTDQKLPVPEVVPAEEMVVGQWSIAVGRTFESGKTNISVGIISALNRIWGRAIQTDAKISPGNYGGPLVDIRGRVLGILVPLSPQGQGELAGAEWYDSGIGFAVPLADVLEHLGTLKSGTDLYPGILGISMPGGDLYSLPAEIAAVQPKSPASEAGLKAKDVIVEVDGQAISRQAQLKHALGRRYAGDQVHLVVKRGDERLEFDVALTDKLEPYEHPFLGVLPSRVPVDGAVGIRFVYPGSPAEMSGITTADQIKAIGETPVSGPRQAQDALANYEPGASVPVLLERDGQQRTVDVVVGSLPAQVPDPLPPARGAVQPAPENQPAVGVIEIKIPEESNQCIAYVPENYDPAASYGLIVWLHAPGGFNQEELVERWKAHCAERDLILLAPQSADAARWVPTEVDFVRKTIDDLLANYQIDPTRIVVHGYQAGGAMAYLLAFAHRDVVRGVAPVDAALPARAAPPANEPVQRLAIYTTVASGSRLAEPIRAGIKRLEEMKFPVTVIEMEGAARYLDADGVSQLARWIDSLDRI